MYFSHPSPSYPITRSLADRNHAQRFLNHHCVPNVSCLPGFYGRRQAMMFRAMRDIAPGEQLFMFYGRDFFEADPVNSCVCDFDPEPHLPPERFDGAVTMEQIIWDELDRIQEGTDFESEAESEATIRPPMRGDASETRSVLAAQAQNDPSWGQFLLWFIIILIFGLICGFAMGHYFFSTCDLEKPKPIPHLGPSVTAITFITRLATSTPTPLAHPIS